MSIHKRQHDILARYDVPSILPLIGQPHKQLFTLPNGESYWVKVSTSRLRCLKDNQSCVWCGRQGNVFVLEKNGNPVPHLNLYYRFGNGDLLMLTQDHLLPKAWGGTDEMDNLATMCERCNRAKGTLTPLHFVCKMTEWSTADLMIEQDNKLHNLCACLGRMSVHA